MIKKNDRILGKLRNCLNSEYKIKKSWQNMQKTHKLVEIYIKNSFFCIILFAKI